jgi:hypothetical protein
MKKDSVKSMIKCVGGLGFLLLLAYMSTSDGVDGYDSDPEPSDDQNRTTYADCVKEINESKYLGSSWKSDIIKIVRRDENSAYYDTVIGIVNSPIMSNSYKQSIIKDIS